MKTYELTIWAFNQKLHEGKYQFATIDQAQAYLLGLFNGFDLCGKKPTGMELKITRKK